MLRLELDGKVDSCSVALSQAIRVKCCRTVAWLMIDFVVGERAQSVSWSDI